MPAPGTPAQPNVAIEPETLGETFLLYRRQLTIGAVVIAAAVGGVWLWQRSVQIKEEKGSVAYQAGEMAYVSGNKPLALTELEKVATRYAGTAAGAQAAMLSAQILFDEGKHAEGIALLQKALGSANGDLKPGIQALLGAGFEATGKSAEAAEAYGKAAEGARLEGERQGYRMDAARAKVAAGDTQGATELYRTLASQEDSPFSGEARVRLGELLGKQ